MEKVENRGGVRKGQGRPLKKEAKLVRISLFVFKEKVEEAKEQLTKIAKGLGFRD